MRQSSIMTPSLPSFREKSTITPLDLDLIHSIPSLIRYYMKKVKPSWPRR